MRDIWKSKLAKHQRKAVTDEQFDAWENEPNPTKKHELASGDYKDAYRRMWQEKYGKTYQDWMNYLNLVLTRNMMQNINNSLAGSEDKDK